MPKKTSEINSGAQFSRSSENGRLADSATRAFRILANQPGEVFDFQKECDIRIGDPYPGNDKLRCTSYSAQYEGSSRMVVLCTFQFGTTAGSDSGGADPKSEPPDIRPANYSTSSSLVEMPAREWFEVDLNGNLGARVPAKNPANDIYDGVTFMAAMMTISVEQWEASDPARHILIAGCVNSTALSIGSLSCAPRTIMFRGTSFRPAVEAWGDLIYRGWNATYEFLYKQDTWDLRVPLTGFNVKAFNPAGAAADQEVYGQPLAHSGGKIADPLALPSLVTAGDKVRAMVKVFEYEDRGSSQLPSAQPVPLNEDGTPRKGSPIIKRYCPYQPIPLAEQLGLRLG